MSGRASKSPEVPENTGSAPKEFAPAPYATRPIPDYPQRAEYADFDPASSYATDATIPSPQAFPRANIAPMIASRAPVKKRGSSEPNARCWRQDAVLDGRYASIPPALETASLTLRERMLYPDRTMDEITVYMNPPVAEPRSCVSEATVEDARSDWEYGWPEENAPQQTEWTGYDTSRYTRYGGWDAPNETAAVANEQVAQSIEIESDPLVALRQSAHDSQVVIRRELDRQIQLEDRNRDLERMVDELRNNEEAFGRAQRDLLERLEMAETDREQFRMDRDVGQRQNKRLRLQVNEPETESRRRDAQDRAYVEARQREIGLWERVQALEESERVLNHQLQSGAQINNRLADERGQLAHNHYPVAQHLHDTAEECERQRDLNRGLQAQVHTLNAQLVASQALNIQIPVGQPPDDAAHSSPPPAVQSPVTAATAGSASGEGSRPTRGGRRGRGSRGGKGATTAVRRQPGRSCKVEKSYRK